MAFPPTLEAVGVAGAAIDVTRGSATSNCEQQPSHFRPSWDGPSFERFGAGSLSQAFPMSAFAFLFSRF